MIQLGAGGSVSAYKVQNAQPAAARPVAVRPVAVQATPVSAYVQSAPVQVRPVAVVAAQPVAVPVSVPVAAPTVARYEAEENYAPAPFAFGFDSEDEYGTKLGRQESASQDGVVTGSYTLSDASGELLN